MAKPSDGIEIVNYDLWDTISAEDCQNGPGMAFQNNHVGQQRLTNMQQPGQIPSGGIFLIKGLSIGAPTETLKLWADASWTLVVGQKPMLEGAIWSPPDAVDSLSALRENGVEYAQVDTPIEWRFSRYSFARPYKISALQSFCVWVNHPLKKELPGRLRLVLHGDISRDIY